MNCHHIRSCSVQDLIIAILRLNSSYLSYEFKLQLSYAYSQSRDSIFSHISTQTMFHAYSKDAFWSLNSNKNYINIALHNKGFNWGRRRVAYVKPLLHV